MECAAKRLIIIALYEISSRKKSRKRHAKFMLSRSTLLGTYQATGAGLQRLC